MNILFDISNLGMARYGGSFRTGIFRVVENLALGLHQTHECKTIFCATHCNHRDCRKVLESYPELKGHIFSQPDDVLATVFNFTESARIKAARLRQKNRIIPFQKIYHWVKTKALPIHKKDIERSVLFHTPFLPFPQQIDQKKKIVKLITIHDLTPVIYPQFCVPATRNFMKKILNSIRPGTFVVCVSEATRQDFLASLPSVDPTLVSVVHLAAADHFYHCEDPEKIQKTKRKYGLPPHAPYFMALSTLHPNKNFERTIGAFLRLLTEERLRDLYLVIVGADGMSSEKIYQGIQNSGRCAGQIILPGYVPDEDLAPLYSGATTFLYPSLYEGFGLPPLEAMQCGTPVITSNRSSLPEVVGQAAIPVDPQDSDALCQAMLDLYKNENLQKTLSSLSLERAKMFSWKKTISGYIASYKKALAAQSSKAASYFKTQNESQQ